MRRPWLLAALLGLLASASHIAQATRLNRTGGRYEICISAWLPMVTCNMNDSSFASGYQVGTAG